MEDEDEDEVREDILLDVRKTFSVDGCKRDCGYASLNWKLQGTEY
jgi:hypothetical protein